MKNAKDKYLEKTYKNFKGAKYKVIRYNKATDITIKFLDTGYIRKIKTSDIHSGFIKDVYNKFKYGVGYTGEGDYKASDKINEKENNRNYHDIWSRMLQRAYDKSFHKKQPTYIGTTVCEEWHNFQNFAKWVEENYNSDYMYKWQIDKDIICPDCREYSPENCCFIPREINNLFTFRGSKRGNLPMGVQKRKNYKKFSAGFSKYKKTQHIGYFETKEEAFQAYKKEKEKYIKEVANKWKDKIDPRAYEALINYEIKITD